MEKNINWKELKIFIGDLEVTNIKSIQITDMIPNKELHKENTSGKAVAKVEEKRNSDVLKSNQKVRRLISKSIFGSQTIKRKF